MIVGTGRADVNYKLCRQTLSIDWFKEKIWGRVVAIFPEPLSYRLQWSNYSTMDECVGVSENICGSLEMKA